ncbi:MAG: hypothetical protein H0W12_08880 [Chitinophagaceae bacterium]|nr:hypothetical protein [Chitinophagaceae bacterium]
MKRVLFLICLIFSFFDTPVFSQIQPTQKIFRIGVFAPLYLDSVFSHNEILYAKSIPKFIMPAVEFVQGAQIAFDTLSLNNEHVEAFIYDTKSYTQPIAWLTKNKVLDSLDLIIGSVKDVDFKQLADFSLKKNIPFISATYPNDGGVTINPFLAILNSTLKAHCEGIYSYILQNHGTDKIFLCKRKGIQEDRIAGYFKALNEQEGRPLLNIQILNFDSTVSLAFLRNKLDSTHQNVIIGASLDEEFAKNITDASYAVSKKNYPVTLIGMPNWDGFRIFSKTSYKDFPIHFTTPYYNNKTDDFSTMLTAEYNRRYKSNPSDMAGKGFEIVRHFTKILLAYPDDFMSHLNDSSFKIFNDFNFRPVYTDKRKTGVPDYFENKHLYVMRILNGAVTREW